MKNIFIPLTIGCLLILSGCGNSKDDSLVGKWKENSDRDVVLEFNEDGVLVILSPGFPKNMDNTGTWELLDDSHLKITSKENPTITNEITISSQSFVIVDHQADVTMEYKRIK